MYYYMADTDWGAVAAAGVQAIGGLTSTIASAELDDDTKNWQHNENQYSRDFSEYMWRKNTQFSKDMWNLQNQYNSPSAQLARLREAGINPFVSQSSVGSGNSNNPAALPSSFGGNSNSLSRTRLPNFLGDAAVTAASVFNQNRAINASVADQNAAKTQKALENAKDMKRLGFSDTKINDYLQQVIGSSSDGLQSSMYVRSEMAQMQQQELQREIMDWHYALGQQYDIKQIEQGLRSAESTIKLNIQSYNWNEKLNSKQIDKIASDIAQSYAAAGMLKKQGEHFRAQTETEDLIRNTTKRMLDDNYEINHIGLQEQRALFTYGTRRRNYMIGTHAQDTDLHNFITNQNEVLNRLNVITKSASIFK